MQRQRTMAIDVPPSLAEEDDEDKATTMVPPIDPPSRSPPPPILFLPRQRRTPSSLSSVVHRDNDAPTSLDADIVVPSIDSPSAVDKGRRYDRRQRRSRGEGERECCRTSGGRWVCHQKEDGESRTRGGQEKLQKKAAKITPAAEKAAQRPPRPQQKGPPTIQTAIRRLTVGGLPMGGRIEGGRRDGNQRPAANA
jgi:hypothetical protein